MRLCVDAQAGECEIICSYEKSDRLIDHCSDKVKNPRYIRYAWQPFTRANLVNGAGLPASTFIASRGQRYEYQLCFFISEMFYCLVKQTLELLEDFFLDGSVRLEVVRAFHFFQCFFLFFVQGFRDIDADIHQ